jgi:Helix-turn-helix domain
MQAISLPAIATWSLAFNHERGDNHMTEVIAHTMTEAARISGLGRTTLYAAIGSGKLDARKSGKRTIVLAESLREFIAGLPVADIRKPA